MGLDTSHDCWHGPYGGFARWRNTLALAAGYKLATDDEGRTMADLPWDMFEDKNYQGEWDTVPGDDPLLYLLAHSDCDGVIHPEHGAHLAARLEQLLPRLGGGPEWVAPRTRQFIDGLRAAARAGEDVDFR
jgi:hypothetical protein